MYFLSLFSESNSIFSLYLSDEIIMSIGDFQKAILIEDNNVISYILFPNNSWDYCVHF